MRASAIPTVIEQFTLFARFTSERQRATVLALAVDGALGRIRTDDQELSRDPLYPLSYEREGG